jgi:uncharacterized hydrophobic protein (TIGR00341 family)
MAEPTLFKLTAEDRRTAIDKLIEGAAPGPEFFLLLVLSSIIVAYGVILDNTSIVIGGMLVAPIMSPILSIAMSVVMADFKLLMQSLKIMAISVGIVGVISTLIALTTVNLEPTNEILSRAESSLAYFVVAIAAGVAAAFAFARPKLSEAIPGIAVTVALLPPLVVSFLGIPLKDSSIFINSFGLFLINFLGIVLASLIIFSLMGFYRQRDQAVKKLEKELKDQSE